MGKVQCIAPYASCQHHPQQLPGSMFCGDAAAMVAASLRSVGGVAVFVVGGDHLHEHRRVQCIAPFIHLNDNGCSTYSIHSLTRTLMPNYRRLYRSGGCWFFTANLLDRRATLLTDHIDLLRDAMRETKSRFPFHIDAIVILPDHIHTIWTLPENDHEFSVRWRRIKARFSKSIPKTEWIEPNRRSRGERGIWQRRFWEHLIEDDDEYDRCMEYIYFNPVAHGYVQHVSDWPHSSFHRDQRIAEEELGEVRQRIAKMNVARFGERGEV